MDTLSSAGDRERERKSEKRGRLGDTGKGKKAKPFHLPRDPRALTILFSSPPTDSVLSLALHAPPLKTPGNLCGGESGVYAV